MPSQALIHILIFALLITLTFSSSPSPAPSPQSPHPNNVPSMSPQSGSSDGPSSDSSPDAALSPSESLPPLSGSPDDDSYADDPSPDVKSSPAPAPSEASDVTAEVKSEDHKESSDKGMSGGKKVGIAFGLIAAACFVGFGGVVYRKRQDNIRRQQYIAAQRLEF